MENAPENFDQLKKLLALKRHEQPPPGYFENFSSKVCARIEAAPKLTWWQQLAQSLDMKPVMVGVYGVGVCGLLLLGVHLANNSPVQTADPNLQGQPMLTGNTGSVDPGLNKATIPGVQVAQTNVPSSTAPDFLFKTPSNAERVNFPAGGN